MNNFQFDGLSEISIEDTQSTFGKFVLYAMLLVFVLASMTTTFSFFATYAPRLGEVIHPTYGAYIAGALGVILFDLAGLGWTVLRARDSDTTRQFVIATIAAFITITLSLLTSGLQVLLSTSFDIGLYDASGNFTQFGQMIQIGGMAVMTLGFVVNFGAISAYVNTSKEVMKAVQTTQLTAYVTAGQFTADNARAQLVIERTLQGIMSQLPAYAQTVAQQNATGYLGQTITPDNFQHPLPSLPKSTNPNEVSIYRIALIDDEQVIDYQEAQNLDVATLVAQMLSNQGYDCEVEEYQGNEWVFLSGWRDGQLWSTPLPNNVEIATEASQED